MVIMEDSKAATVVLTRGGGVDIGPDGMTATSPTAEVITLNNNSADSLSPATDSPTSGTAPPTANGTTNVYLIGLEFVRQYYTVLHQGPLYLHRFYSEQSCFVHDDSKVVYGQQGIRDRIQQLNFRNCVAKILQVDSQETLGNGVVIQVRGELSNNGKPLRRFMQTFVLAPQSPKRYYVRNDIFHYQDDEPGKESLSTGSCAEPCLSIDNPEDEKSDVEEEEVGDGVGMPPVDPVSPAIQDPVIVSIKTEKVESLAEPVVPEVSLLDTTSKPEVKSEEETRRPSHGFVMGAPPAPALDEEPAEAPTPKEPETAATTSVPATGAKTYANLFKSGLTGATNLPAASLQFSNRNPFPVKPSVPPTTTEPAEVTELTSPQAVSPQPPAADAGRGIPPRGQQQAGSGYVVRDRGGFGYRDNRDRRDTRERLTSRSSDARADDTGSIDGDTIRPRPINMFPDSHQLFVGNLPHTVTVLEIKEIFNVFGRVADVKILKPNQKNAGAKVPYFCFVVFEEAAFAQAAINEKTKITMKMSDGSNRRLNVEEKRPRESGSFGGPYFPRDNMGGFNMSGGPGGPGGNTFRPGGLGHNGGQPRPPHPSVGGNSGPAGGENRSQQQQQPQQQQQLNQPRTHSRTFRGSNRGGGAERGGGGGAR